MTQPKPYFAIAAALLVVGLAIFGHSRSTVMPGAIEKCMSEAEKTAPQGVPYSVACPGF
ncbi:hypothetical protein [Mesorhizobium waimense]|uniref:hypothetical protein n=1 Tax=Mesorhizobium waimense TaxID=1300307 RepID=UPI00142DC37D|nr:hypothetical protein [Mesorhizobium waimense]